MDYKRQTASTTPTFSGVKVYIAQSNPSHFWVTFRKIEIIKGILQKNNRETTFIPEIISAQKK